MIFRRRRRDVRSTAVWPVGWDVPASFDLTRDVVEGRGRDVSACALTYVDAEGIVDRRTYREVAEDAARWAHALRRRVREPGSTVVIATGSTPDTVLALLGALKGGLVAAPVGSGLAAAELAQRLRATGAAVLVAERSAEDTVDSALEQLDSAPHVVYLDEAATELRRYRPTAPTEERSTTDPAVVLFTAGVADEPKGVVHPHAAVWAARTLADHWLGAGERDLVWGTARAGTPEWLWHGVLAPLAVGAEAVLHDGPFEPGQRLDLLQRLAVTVLCQSPTAYRALAELGAAVPGALPRLREALATGEPLEPELVERYSSDAGIGLRDGLTQGECALVAGTLADMPARPGVLGVGPPGHDVAVIDGDGQIVAPDEEGELALLGRPPTLFTSYLGPAALTEAVFRDGWYLTGDRCVNGADGMLRFVRRADDLIVAGGERIGPLDVEAAIRSHPLVDDVAAVTGHGPDGAPVLKAYVTLAAGAEQPADLAAVLAEHVADVAAPKLAPAAVEVVDELPRTTAGAVRRGELRRLEDARAEAAAEEARRREREAAAAAEAERRRWLAEREEEHRLAQEAERARAEEERRQLLEEEARQRREEQEERERVEREAAAALAAERAELERVERERRERERAEHEAAVERERAKREAARRAEEERKQSEQAERDAVAAVRRAEREAARQAEEERKRQQEAERAAATERQRAEREAEREAEEERRREEQAKRDAEETRRREEQAARHAAEREERERRERERAEREAARRAEAERRQAAVAPATTARTEAPETTEAPAPVADATPAPEGPPAETPPAAPPAEAPAPAAAPQGLGGEDTDISGLADRIRRYANVEEPSEERPFGWRRATPPDDDEL